MMTPRPSHRPGQSRRPAAASRSARPRLEALEDRLAPATLLALTGSNSLLRFDSGTPTVTTTTNISGLNSGESVLGIDYRPANGLLYAITDQERLLTINAATGSATFVANLTADPTDGTNPFTDLNGTAFGVDFNPVPDRLRVVSDTNQNLRINVDNGRVITDADLNPGTPDVVASAYLNNFAGTTGTTLYGLDAAAERLVIQNPPNNGTLATVGTNLGAGLDVTLSSGFDIVTTGGPTTRTNTAFATLVDTSVTPVTGLYQIDLTAGTASSLGLIGLGTTPIRGLAVVPAGTVQFRVSSQSAAEDIGSATITVTRTGGSLGAVSVDFATSNGTAISGQDYSPTNGTITFTDGDTAPKTFQVTLLDDQLVEGVETVNLALSNATGDAVVGANGTMVLAIADDELPRSALYAVAQTTVDTTPNAYVLVELAADSPGTARRTIPILGLNTGEAILGIDFRPADGLLYAVTSLGRLLTINTAHGNSTVVANLTADPADLTNPFTGLSGTSFGIDFNPTLDRLRVVSDSGQNLSVNPANGRVTTQTALNPGSPDVVGAAYTNSFLGAGSTTLYGIDSAADQLVIQDPPNGTLTPVGVGLGVDTGGLVGFEIVSFNNQAFASLTPAGATSSQLHSVNLTTGEANLIGAINAGAAVQGLSSRTVNTLNYSDTERFVNQMFLDLLGRAADPAARAAFSDFIDQGASRADAVRSVLGSEEYRTKVVQALYQRLLGRPADAAGLDAFVNFLGSGGTLAEATAVIVGSNEYFQNAGGTVNGFLARAYRDLLGRTIDASGQAAFAAALQNGSLTRADVARSLQSSQEGLQRQVNQLYRNFLGRPADAAGQAAFTNFLANGGSLQDAIAAIVASEEYDGRIL